MEQDNNQLKENYKAIRKIWELRETVLENMDDEERAERFAKDYFMEIAGEEIDERDLI